MANLYFHFPFCKQACHYCNFHFSTSTKNRIPLLQAIHREMELRADEINGSLETLYFGGGSPSLLSPKQLNAIITRAFSLYQLTDSPEITLEANPDDINEAYLTGLREAGVNRISLGIQSLFDSELQTMNRAHNVTQALESLELVARIFNNFSVDLIYGMPGSSLQTWEYNLAQILTFNPPHISTYALTVEPKTALHHQVKKNTVTLLDENIVKEQYDHLIKRLDECGYENYEFSNFGKPGYHSVNNTNYWNGKPYLGIGPSAHSYDGHAQRSWNLANNLKYRKAIAEGRLPTEREQLSPKDRYNEYVMTALRTARGISLEKVVDDFGNQYALYLEKQAEKHLLNHFLFWDGDYLKVSKSAKFLTDGLAADLFLIQF